MKKRLLAIVVALFALMAVMPVIAQDEEPVELRMVWYNDGNEGEVMRDLLDAFEADNPDIRVVMDTVAYNSILEQLPLTLQANEGPDLARVTDLGGLKDHYLDIRDYLSEDEAAYITENFGSYLSWLRDDGSDAINGIHTQLTVTGPYINRTLFEQAEVDVPSDVMDAPTWQDWVDATTAVAEATETDFPMVMDRSGHRFAGPAISMGADYFTEEGFPTVMDDGFESMAEMFVNWHEEGVMPMDVWAGATGYAAPNEEFINARAVFYMSGSWQISQFAEQIGDAFDWEAVPNPCGPAACTGIPGGASLVAIDDTEHPEAVARVLNYLAQEEVVSEFYRRTLFLPAHAGVAEAGVDYDTELAQVSTSLNVFGSQVAQLDPVAIRFQGYTYNRAIMNATTDRLTQALVGELTLEEALDRAQEDINEALAAEGIDVPEMSES